MTHDADGLRRLTALILAAVLGHKEAVELRVYHHGTLNAQDRCLQLNMVTKKIVNLLIQIGANVNAQETPATSLMYANKYGHTDIANLLISSGANVNAHDSDCGRRRRRFNQKV